MTLWYVEYSTDGDFCWVEGVLLVEAKTEQEAREKIREEVRNSRCTDVDLSVGSGRWLTRPSDRDLQKLPIKKLDADQVVNVFSRYYG